MRKSIMAFFSVFLLVTFLVTFAGCGAKVDPNYSYRVAGHFSNWGEADDAGRFTMEPVSKSDNRIAPLKGALKGAQYIYLYEYTPNRANPAGWTFGYSGAGITYLDGIFAIKFIRLVKDDSEPSGWAPDVWMPSTEMSGFRSSLSPNTIYVPMDRSDEAADAAADGLGSVNSNPALLKGSVTYYVVLAIFKDKTKGIGAVVK